LNLTIFDNSLGKWFGNNGDRYEGYLKDSNPHGQGKKEVISFDLLIQTLFDCLMIQQVRYSCIMEIDMKASFKMATFMAKVRKK